MSMNYLAGFVDTYGKNTWKRFVEGGLPTAILGMVTVFAVLSILWGCLEIFKYVFYTLPKRREEAEQDEAVSEEPIATKVLASQVEEPVSYADDGAIVAAIIAAITAARAEEGIPQTNGFRVVSFRKKK